MTPRCLICNAPVEDEDRNWIDPDVLMGGRRFWLCNFHHEPIRDGSAWIEVSDDGVSWLCFKKPITVSRLRV